MRELYDQACRFGSSYEHSDAWSVAQLWGETDDKSQVKVIKNHPNDHLVEVALGFALVAIATLIQIVVAAFKLDEPQRMAALHAALEKMHITGT
jgi:hypothetical protein